MKKLLLIVGTRPNYIKVTQFKKIAEEKFQGKFEIKLVHTGQHFDTSMADVFFQQLDIWPDYFLNIPPLSANTQIAEIMLRLEKILEEFNPAWVIVPGDVNSTLAAALCAHKCGYKLAHLESGLRSFDTSMPEEINRIITDQVSDIFLVTEQSGITNLLNEGKQESAIHLTGNTMIDTMIAFDDKIRENTKLVELELKPKGYFLTTMHRPSTVDSASGLSKLCNILEKLSEGLPVVFPIHHRTIKKLKEFNLWEQLNANQNIILTESLDYFSFQNLVLHSKFVLTDSGGIQEETTYRQIPCLTLRANTERPVTITEGSNTLISFSLEDIQSEVNKIMNGSYKKGNIPALWDGNSTERVLELLRA